MLRTLITGVITLLFLLSSLIPFTSSQSNNSNNSMQELIDNANSGDTIYISSGIYYEHIVVDKPLTIVGDGAETTIVDGMGEDEHIFNIVSDDVSISGFTIRNCSIGFSGIRINNDSCNIHNNIFKMCGGGVELWDVKDLSIDNNIIEENTWGIYVHSSIDCSISNNTILNNNYGMEVGYSSIKIKNNFIKDNELYGTLKLWCDNTSIDGNTFLNHSNAALQLYSSKQNIIKNNVVKDNYKGISLDDSIKNNLSLNNASENRYGIYLWYNSNNNHIIENTLYHNFNGVYLGSSEFNNFTSNNIINNIDSGFNIGFESSNNIFYKNNVLRQPQEGFYVFQSNNNTIIENQIFNNQRGIYLAPQSSSIITRNYIFNNTGSGIITLNSNYNNISCNNFYKNYFDFDLLYGNNNHISYNYINDSYIGINCKKSDYNKIISNTIINSTGNPIQLTDFSNYNIVSRNNISDYRYQGIALGESSNNTVSYNNISDGYGTRSGIFIWTKCYNNHIFQNRINFNRSNYIPQPLYNYDRALSGIFLSDSSKYNIIESNLLNNTREGILIILNAADNIILKNNIFNSIIGIHSLRNSKNNTIDSNTVQNCSKYGIFLNDSSKKNVIRGNNLIGNQVNVFFNDSYPNFWFSNYWNDWNRKTPKPIFGEIRLERLDKIVPWIQFDWNPATEPYDI